MLHTAGTQGSVEAASGAALRPGLAECESVRIPDEAQTHQIPNPARCRGVGRLGDLRTEDNRQQSRYLALSLRVQECLGRRSCSRSCSRRAGFEDFTRTYGSCQAPRSTNRGEGPTLDDLGSSLTRKRIGVLVGRSTFDPFAIKTL